MKSLRSVLRARIKSVAELLLCCLHVTRNNTALCRQAMTVSLADMAIWQAGSTEPGIKSRRSSLKDMSGCGGIFVLADLVLRHRNGIVSSSHTCWKLSWDSSGRSNKQAMHLNLKSWSAQGLLISKEGFHGLLLPLPKPNLLFLLFFFLLTLADVCSQWYWASKEPEWITPEVSPLQAWLLQALILKTMSSL